MSDMTTRDAFAAGYANGAVACQPPEVRMSANPYWSSPSGLKSGTSSPIATHDVADVHEIPVSAAECTESVTVLPEISTVPHAPFARGIPQDGTAGTVLVQTPPERVSTSGALSSVASAAFPLAPAASEFPTATQLPTLGHERALIVT